MKLHIRQFTKDDYPALVDIHKVVYPEYPESEVELRFEDEHRDPKCRFGKWVAELGGEIAGICQYDQWPGMYHPRKFNFHIVVYPEHRRKGVGSALYDHLIVELQRFELISARSGVREDYEDGIRFLMHRGYEEQNRNWESRLDVNKFDFSPYEGLEQKVLSQGIEIKTFRQLESDPERNRRLHEMSWELFQDVPTSEPITKMDYEFFVDRIIKDPNLLPDGYFVALDGDEYIGMSNLWASQDSDELFTGLTGMRRPYRRRGIALTLKLRGIAYAKSKGHPTIRTWNDTRNRPMLAINERLGFVKQPVWINFVKVFREE